MRAAFCCRAPSPIPSEGLLLLISNPASSLLRRRLARACAALLTLAAVGAMAGCGDDKIATRECVYDRQEWVVCDDGQSQQLRSCAEGRWVNSRCDVLVAVCENGVEQRSACDSGATQIETWQLGQWIELRSCEDTCTPGEREPSVCGLNRRGERADTCTDGGVWDPGTCEDPDVCADGEPQVIACDAYGEQAQRCVEGQWENEGACELECQEGATSTEACGLNERGAVDLRCEEGQWVEEAPCDDPDVCEDDDFERHPCEAGPLGAVTHTCVHGQWDIRSCEGAQLTGNSTKADSTVVVRTRVCALDYQGHLHCAGGNTHGELGIGNTSTQQGWRAPETPALHSITAGQGHSCAVSEAGEVYCWGHNSHGQLGDNSLQSLSTPQLVPGLQDVVQVAAGHAHTCALRANGAVLCWGPTAYGQLGLNPTIDAAVPATAMNITGVTKIFAGANNTCAIDNTRQLFCWGQNESGQVGNNTVTDAVAPTKVTPMSDVTDVGIGSTHICAVNATRAYCWGSNLAGQLGDETFTNRRRPTEVELSQSILQIEAGYQLTCALIADRSVFCWGQNEFGELGRGGAVVAESSPTPARVLSSTQSTEISISTGSFALSLNTACAMRQDGALRCWGYWGPGLPGEPSSNSAQRTPQVVDPPTL